MDPFDQSRPTLTDGELRRKRRAHLNFVQEFVETQKRNEGWRRKFDEEGRYRFWREEVPIGQHQRAALFHEMKERLDGALWHISSDLPTYSRYGRSSEYRMIDEIIKFGFFSKELAEVMVTIYRVFSLARRSETVSDEQLSYVRAVGTELITALESIEFE